MGGGGETVTNKFGVEEEEESIKCNENIDANLTKSFNNRLMK